MPNSDPNSKSFIIAQSMARALRVVNRNIPQVIRAVESRYPAWADSKRLSEADMRQILRAVNSGLYQSVYIENSPLSQALLKVLQKESSQEAIAINNNQKDRFGLTFAQRRERAASKLYGQIEDHLRARGGKKEPISYQQAQDMIRENLISHYNLKTWASYDGARVKNLQIIVEAQRENLTRYRWKLSPGHRVPDICNDFAGIYNISQLIIPPVHPHCRCIVIPILSSKVK